MEEIKIDEILNTKRKTTNNIKKNNLILPKSDNKLNNNNEDIINLDDILNDYLEENGIFFTEKKPRKKIIYRENFISKIPSPCKDVSLNIGQKYPDFQSKL